MVWKRVPRNMTGSPRRLAKSTFDTWIYSHLLKICLPYPREPYSDRPILAPLNLTFFLGLLIEMENAGYPAHWLSAVLQSACSGTIITTARASRTIVAEFEPSQCTTPSRKISVAPWRAELTTLLSVWYHILPFGILTPKGALLPLTSISQYQTSFPEFDDLNRNVPHFMILFWNLDVAGTAAPPRSIRRLLLDDELGDTSSSAQKIREEGVHCLTTFRWTSTSRTGTYWLRDDVINSMMAGAWKVYIWRVDTWEASTSGVDVAAGVTRMGNWTQA